MQPTPAAGAAHARHAMNVSPSGTSWSPGLGVAAFERDNQRSPYGKGSMLLGDSTISMSRTAQGSPRDSFFSAGDTTRQSYQLFDGTAPHQQHQQPLTLADLPVDGESQQSESGVGMEMDRRLKAQGSMLQVFIDFFKKPHLFKVLVFAAVMFATFFFVGIFARIAQFVFGLWAALKVLQLLDDDDGGKTGGASPSTFSSKSPHNMD